MPVVIAPTRKCPHCNHDMVKMQTQNQGPDPSGRVWDLGFTGAHITRTSTTSASDYWGTSASVPPEYLKTRTVVLIPYKCSACGHIESYRE
jgi:hypothetical protein